MGTVRHYVALALLLASAGCGSGAAPGIESGTTASTATPRPTPSPAPHLDTSRGDTTWTSIVSVEESVRLAVDVGDDETFVVDGTRCRVESVLTDPDAVTVRRAAGVPVATNPADTVGVELASPSRTTCVAEAERRLAVLE